MLKTERSNLGLQSPAAHEIMAAAAEAKQYREAEKVLTAAIAKTYQRYPNLEDEDIKRTLMIAQKYQEVLRKHNQERDPKSDL